MPKRFRLNPTLLAQAHLLPIRDAGVFSASLRLFPRPRFSVLERLRPASDALVGAAGFENARRRSIEGLGLKDGDRVLIVGAGTGLDLELLPPTVAITAIDVTPAMLQRLTRRAAHAGSRVSAHVMDARNLTFPDATFDAVRVFRNITLSKPCRLRNNSYGDNFRAPSI